LDNAIKFTKEKIFVKITETPSQVIVEVKDFGPGIDQEIPPNIFSKFASKSDVGTGLGLYISKSIIEVHGGRIWAQNNNIGEKRVLFSHLVYQIILILDINRVYQKYLLKAS
jgi:signal transduction histidine kinase